MTISQIASDITYIDGFEKNIQQMFNLCTVEIKLFTIFAKNKITKSELCYKLDVVYNLNEDFLVKMCINAKITFSPNNVNSRFNLNLNTKLNEKEKYINFKLFLFIE